MPRLYITPTDFASYPEALTFSAQMVRLTALSGAVDRMLAQATRRVDGYCRKRVVGPPTTTIAVGGGIVAGVTSVNVTSTLGFDNGQETAIYFNPGGANQEIVPVLPGGIVVTTPLASPYPGSIQLAQPTLLAHSAGETVQGLYQEVSTVGNSGSSDVYSESLLELNQAAQLARAHAPRFDTSGLTRVIFVKQFPVVKLYKLEHMLPIDTQYSPFDVSLNNVGIHPSAGYLRLPLGSFVLPEGLMRTTYTAGFANPSDEVQQATALYMADALQNMVTMGASQSQQGKLRMVVGQSNQSKSKYVQDAEQILTNANLVRKT